MLGAYACADHDNVIATGTPQPSYNRPDYYVSFLNGPILVSGGYQPLVENQ